jgi:hypothetical protein
MPEKSPFISIIKDRNIAAEVVLKKRFVLLTRPGCASD